MTNSIGWAIQTIWKNVLRQEGQDLVEYALVVALIALAATAGMGTLASGINTAFSTMGSTISSDL